MAGFKPRLRLILPPVLKLVGAVIGLFILQALVSAFPMMRDLPVPSRIPFSAVDITGMVIAAVIVFLIVRSASEIKASVETAFPAAPHGGTLVRWVMLLAAVFIAYGAYRGLANALLGEYAWTYSLAFLGLAFVPVASVALLIYRNIDKLTGTNGTKCPSCSAALYPGTKFCAQCGTPAPVAEATEEPLHECPSCGAALSGGSKFCPECGKAPA